MTTATPTSSGIAPVANDYPPNQRPLGRSIQLRPPPSALAVALWLGPH
jgi:hypothetical protein